MPLETIGDLRKAVTTEGKGWLVNPALTDTTLIARHAAGGDPLLLAQADITKRLDVFALVRSQPPANAFLHADLLSRGILPAALPAAGPAAAGSAPAGSSGGAGGGGRPAVVDWRNRYGWPWITAIRDQDPCEHCWIYSATALIEAMVRIEHCVWSPRSVGDYIEANKTPCGQCGDPTKVLKWAATNGLADLETIPWVDRNPVPHPGAYWNPPPDKCGGGSMAAPPAYAPAGIRSGRTTRVPAYTSLNSVDDQKAWIDAVGPIVLSFDVYSDFFGWSGTHPYKKVSTATLQGSHVVLAVGYDDTLGGWIIKNSWGTGWGNGGFGLIGYGEVKVDSYTKYGLRGVNPDPYTKRRLHAGGIVESGNGALHRNFELVAPSAGGGITHWWRDNSSGALPWAKAKTFANDAADPPTFTGTSFNRNFEMIYRTTQGRLHHRYFDQGAGNWVDGPTFGPTGAHGCVGFVESNFGLGNFEVVVGVGDAIQHWWRDSAFNWRLSVSFGANVATAGPSLIQTNLGLMECIAVLKSGQMQHWWRREAGGELWISDAVFGSGISSAPCMIQGQFGMADELGNGNYELVVANGAGAMEHWWRDNQSPAHPWARSAVFGANISRVIALIESSFGFNLEVVAIRTDGMLQHYWRDGAGWHTGVVIGSTH